MLPTPRPRPQSAGPGGAATGSIWKVEATVNPQGMAPNPTNSTLASVSATGPGEAWAVGTFMDQKALDHPLAEHRSGSTWTRVPVPQPAGQQALLNAVDDLSPGNAWAVGTSFSGGVGATPGRADPDRALERNQLVDRAQPEPGHRHPG